MSVEFDTPANRIIQQLQPKNQFRINTSLPDLTFLRQLSVQGRLRYDFLADTSGVSLSIVPTIGETYFLYRVLASLTGNTGALRVTNNGQRRAQANMHLTNFPVFTLDILDSLVGDSIKSIDIELTGTANGNVTALGWVENTSRIRDVTS